MLADTSLTDASDGLAITMVLLIGFSLGMILTILVVMARNSGKKPDVMPEEDEVEKHPQPQRQGKDTDPSWERDGDWWKNGDDKS